MNKAYMGAAAMLLALAAGPAQAGSKLGVGTDGRSGNGVQLNGIPASSSAVESVRLPDGLVLAGRKPGVSSGTGV